MIASDRFHPLRLAGSCCCSAWLGHHRVAGGVTPRRAAFPERRPPRPPRTGHPTRGPQCAGNVRRCASSSRMSIVARAGITPRSLWLSSRVRRKAEFTTQRREVEQRPRHRKGTTRATSCVRGVAAQRCITLNNGGDETETETRTRTDERTEQIVARVQQDLSLQFRRCRNQLGGDADQNRLGSPTTRHPSSLSRLRRTSSTRDPSSAI